MARVLLLICSGLAVVVLAFRTLAHFTGLGAHTITTITAQSTTVRHIPVAILPGPTLGVLAVLGLIAGTWAAWAIDRRG